MCFLFIKAGHGLSRVFYEVLSMVTGGGFPAPGKIADICCGVWGKTLLVFGKKLWILEEPMMVFG